MGLIILLMFGLGDWKTLKTDNFKVIYKPGYEWEANEAMKNLEYYREKINTLTGNSPKYFPIVIEDIGTIPNGMADPVFHSIHIYTYPPGGNDIGGTQNWYRQVALHEYTHICHLTKTTGLARITTSLFGTIFQPNMYAPGWIIEGITVYSESQLSPYEGRLNDGYFDSYIAVRAAERKLPSIHTATYSPLEFPGWSGIYLYGGEFFNYLSQRYGEKKFAEFFDTYGSYFPFIGLIFPGLGIDGASRRIYGKSFPDLFTEWQLQEQKKYGDWKTEGKRVTRRGWQIDYLTKDKDKIYYFRQYPRKTGALETFWNKEIIALNIHSQKEKKIVSLTSSVSAPLIVKENNLYYTTYEVKKGYANVTNQGFGFVSSLHTRDLMTGKDRVLFCDNIRAFCVLDDGSILYSKDRAHEFGSELWVYKNGKKEKIWATEYLIGELKANSNYIVVSARKDFENWDVYLVDLEAKKFTPIATTPWIEYNIELQGDTVVFTANYDKMYSIYAYNLLSRKLYRVSKVGYAKSGLLFNDTLYFIGLTKDGFDIYKKVPEFTSSPPISYSPSIKPDFSSIPPPKQGGYFDVLSTLFKPAVHIPFILPVDTLGEKWLLGAVLIGRDATHENAYYIFFVQDPIKNEPILESFFISRFFSPLVIGLLYSNVSLLAQLQMSYPLLVRISPGLSNISVSLRGAAFGKQFHRKEIAPGGGLGFRFPFTRIGIEVETPFERKNFGSTIDRSAQYVGVDIRNYTRVGGIKFSVQAHNDPDNPDAIRIRIRGGDSLYAKTGAILTTEYSHPIFKIRKGLWNPNMFFEDLCFVLFNDIALSKEGEYNASVGVELKLETGMMFGFLRFAPKVGVAINKEGKQIPYWGVDF